MLQVKGYGDAYAWQHQVQLQLKQWQQSEGASVPPLQQWQQQQQAMQQALDAMPRNAAFINTMGLLYEFRALNMELSLDGRTRYAGQATALFRQVTVDSPAWLYGWLNLARIKLRTGQVDDEFSQAYLRAAQLGPWERDSMATLFEMGLATHQLLSAQQERQVQAYLVRVASARGVWFARPLVVPARSWPQLCDQLDMQPHTAVFEQICGSTGNAD